MPKGTDHHFKTEVIYETTFFCKKDCISVLKSQLTLCAQNTKCFNQRLHPIGGAQGKSDYIRMHFTTWGKISLTSSTFDGIWFQQVTPQKPFRMICEPFGKKLQIVFAFKMHYSRNFGLEFGGCEFRQRLEARGKVCFFVTQTKETHFGSNAKVKMQCVRRREEILHVFADGRTSLCKLLAPHGQSLTPWNRFPINAQQKKVSSSHVKCNFFCSKTRKKVVSYLTSVLNDKNFYRNVLQLATISSDFTQVHITLM